VPKKFKAHNQPHDGVLDLQDLVRLEQSCVPRLR